MTATAVQTIVTATMAGGDAWPDSVIAAGKGEPMWVAA
jgi:hypothetical protein